MSAEDRVDQQNAEFWNELCGTGLAKSIGITDHSPASLRRFDQAYLEIYPYLAPFLRIPELRGKRVLEVGLGYGTVSQLIAESGADYVGMDLAPNPVGIVQHRLRMIGSDGGAVVGNVLCCPFRAESFDTVVTIGCLHHTGNLERAVHELWRLLRPGGVALVMLYNRYSLRQWTRWPRATLEHMLGELGLSTGSKAISAAQRAAYDLNQQGEGAPVVEFVSTSEARRLFGLFDRVDVQRENMDTYVLPSLLGRAPRVLHRKMLLGNVAKVFGLDLYLRAYKGL